MSEKEEKKRSKRHSSKVPKEVEEAVDQANSKAEKRKSRRKKGASVKSDKKAEAPKLGLNLSKAKEEDTPEALERKFSASLFSPRPAHSSDAEEDELRTKKEYDIFSPPPTGSVALEKSEMLSSKTKRDSIRREIRKSIRSSRHLEPIPDDLILDVPSEVIATEKNAKKASRRVSQSQLAQMQTASNDGDGKKDDGCLLQ